MDDEEKPKIKVINYLETDLKNSQIELLKNRSTNLKIAFSNFEERHNIILRDLAKLIVDAQKVRNDIEMETSTEGDDTGFFSDLPIASATSRFFEIYENILDKKKSEIDSLLSLRNSLLDEIKNLLEELGSIKAEENEDKPLDKKMLQFLFENRDRTFIVSEVMRYCNTKMHVPIEKYLDKLIVKGLVKKSEKITTGGKLGQGYQATEKFLNIYNEYRQNIIHGD